MRTTGDATTQSILLANDHGNKCHGQRGWDREQLVQGADGPAQGVPAPLGYKDNLDLVGRSAVENIDE